MERTLGYWLKLARVGQGIPQNLISIKLNISHTTISKYESDSLEPSVRTLMQIASLYKMSLDKLTGFNYKKRTRRLKPNRFYEDIENKLLFLNE